MHLHPRDFRRYRTLAAFPALLHQRQNRREHAQQQHGWKRAQSLRHSLLAGVARFRLQQTFGAQHLDQFADRPDLTPNHAQYQCDQDQQVQNPFLQTRLVKGNNVG